MEWCQVFVWPLLAFFQPTHTQAVIGHRGRGWECVMCPNHLSRLRFITSPIDLELLPSTLSLWSLLLTRWSQPMLEIFRRCPYTNNDIFMTRFSTKWVVYWSVDDAKWYDIVKCNNYLMIIPISFEIPHIYSNACPISAYIVRNVFESYQELGSSTGLSFHALLWS